MDLKENSEIIVMKKSIMFMRICFIFPSDEEIAHPEKNVFIKFTMLNILASFYPVGVFWHMVLNIKSKSSIKCNMFNSFLGSQCNTKLLYICLLLICKHLVNCTCFFRLFKNNNL